MSFYLSLYSCWLPRSIVFQRSISHSNFSTKPVSISKLSSRLNSRFSLKATRFTFLKRRIQLNAYKTRIVSLSTHDHHPKKDSYHTEMHVLARSFLSSIEPEYRKVLHEELIQMEKPIRQKGPVKIHPSQLFVVFLETGLPYIGFGFVDNFIMLVAGETIETFFGAIFCISTMAAAALGNAVSDSMGIGLAHRIEKTCGRLLALIGMDLPKLTRAQWESPSVHVTQFISKVFCIFFGCILGMCPLLFRNISGNKNKSTKDDKDD